ncbi:cysteine peptidase family C39 domain-containing protein [Kordia algicida OT-1]|uniref:ABC transporter ATP-binding protein n=1 Tax=Kordia algicida OT-1 TaxID=391587 RepID=A9DNA0_9FLAO|nr:cysteine peptidase family C39 domain-containing protein [Kordia algicida]EDP97144.1 ABC transporter ATP-binding protein [Kordia algicida OT-1]
MKYLISFFCLALLFAACERFEKPAKPFPLYFQKTPSECGPACLKMVSDHYGGDYTFETLALISQMKRYEGTSMGQISEAASMLGLYNLAVKIDYQTLLEEVPYPAMLHWDGHHFLVVYKMDKDSVWLADPARGYVSYTKEEFLPHWLAKDTLNPLQEGYALLFEPTDSFFDPRTKIKVQIQSRIEKKKKDALILQEEEDN